MNSNIHNSGKELKALFSANRQTTAKKHHRQISSIIPIITETSKYRDEYDLSQEELVENFISWKKHFEDDVRELQLESPKHQSKLEFLFEIVNNTYKPLNFNKATPMKIQDDSLYIADECKIDELPSFNLPKNSAVSGTGRKQGRFTRDSDVITTPFKYHVRSKVVFNNSASPSRPS